MALKTKSGAELRRIETMRRLRGLAGRPIEPSTPLTIVGVLLDHIGEKEMRDAVNKILYRPGPLK
jgi:hypothetical protein